MMKEDREPLVSGGRKNGIRNPHGRVFILLTLPVTEDTVCASLRPAFFTGRGGASVPLAHTLGKHAPGIM
jgi:hypothetical protein